MNKLKVFRRLFTSVSGLFSTWLLLKMIVDFSWPISMLEQDKFFIRILILLLLVIFSGWGIKLNFSLLEKNETIDCNAVWFAVIYSILQLSMNIIPEFRACNCMSLRDVIFSVEDWDNVEYGVILLILNGTLLLFQNKGKKYF